jgi:transposase InsO family protein
VLLREKIKTVHQASRQTYGALRVTAALHAEGIRCGHNRVARIMRNADIAAKRRKKRRSTTDARHQYPVVANIVDRQFTAPAPNRVWLSDVTVITTARGKVYLAAVLDMFSRVIVGWAMGRQVSSALVGVALEQAIQWRRPAPGLVIHSDRGGEYAAYAYRGLVASARMIPSMSRAGDCWDNAPMESFFGTLKKELVHHERFKSREEAQLKIFDYLEIFYNRQRLHSQIGYLSPRDYEERHEELTTNSLLPVSTFSG